MSEHWMPELRLSMTREEFDRLPRNAAYSYHLIDGVAWVNPRPRYYHARFDLRRTLEAASSVRLRRLEGRDWERLEAVFAASFEAHQPFAGLSEEKRALAARACLDQTRREGDGPLIGRASFVAVGEDALPVGAILVTLLPPGDPTDWDSYYWSSPPPADCVEAGYGVPHVTWVFVEPGRAGRGVATALLRAAAAELRAMGFGYLLSTFLTGSEASLMWHWRAGFELLGYPGSPRRYFPLA